ncbi:hypothetical protein EDB84DRAFT_1491009, partial [Lactarius hengduanensis]
MPNASDSLQLLLQEDMDATPVFPIIHMIRTVCLSYFSRPYHFTEISPPGCHGACRRLNLTYTLVRPLAEKYRDLQHHGNKSVVFCLLLNRVHFFRDDNTCDDRSLPDSGLSMRNIGHQMSTRLLSLLPAGPSILAPNPVNDDLEDRCGNAIEWQSLARPSVSLKAHHAKRSSNSIWSLKVPAIRSVLEYFNFLILLYFSVIAVELKRGRVAFMIYSLGVLVGESSRDARDGIRGDFSEFPTTHHPLKNGFDLAFIPIFCTYAILRIYGIYHPNDQSICQLALGQGPLALTASRLSHAFSSLGKSRVHVRSRLGLRNTEEHLMVLSLRAMISQFVFLMLIAAFCFGGFLYAFWTQISWWMVDIWFGLAAGFEKAPDFNKTIGPILMVTYACLSNTLLLTVLILSHTFSTISEDAAAEAMFRRAVSNIEGVKADSLFSYQPPINLFALWILLPASYTLTPRWFHKVNVFLIRLTNFPILLTIAFYERQAKKTGSVGVGETLVATTERFIETLPRNMRRWSSVARKLSPGGGSDIDAIFELEEQLDSALDTHDSGALPPIGRQRTGSIRQTRGSVGSKRIPSMS